MAEQIYSDVEIHSILASTKKKLGPGADYDAFDHDIIVSINSAFATLFDVCGLGGDAPIRIYGPEENWEDFITDPRLEWVKDYVYMKVKLAFDPPNNSFLIENIKTQIAELEWRIYNVLNDYYNELEEE